MFHRIFGSNNERAAVQAETALTTAPTTAGETATVRRIVARLEAMPAEQARFIASAAYTLARAANADMEISAEETAEIERALQESVDEPTAVLVTEMAKLQARTVGGTEDYVVTREFRNLANDAQRLDVLRACYAISAASGSISAEENVVVNEIARELDIDPAAVNEVRSAYHDRISAVQEVRRLAGTD